MQKITRSSLVLALIILVLVTIRTILPITKPEPFLSPLALHSPIAAPFPSLDLRPTALEPKTATGDPYNLDFESIDPTSHWAYWWNPLGGPYFTEFGEINTPSGWTATFFDQYECPGTIYWQTGRPEVGLITANVDATRIRSGDRALKLFTFHRCHIAGVYQQFATLPGVTYRFSIYPQAWMSNCSAEPHFTECALDWDCQTCMYPDHAFYVGLDPNGGVNPMDILPKDYTIGVGMYGQYSYPLVTTQVATGYTMTAHFLSVAPLPWRHDDVYADDATIERVYYRHLPIILKEAG